MWPRWWSPTTSAPGRSSSPRPSSTRPSPTRPSPRPAPWLTLVDAAGLARLSSLRLTLSVNGEVRQDASAADMIVAPAQALTLLSRFQPLAPGDLLLTGTPGGTALKAPAKAVETLAGPAAARRQVAAVLPPAGRQPPLPARRRRHHRQHRHRRTGSSISAPSAPPSSGRRHDHRARGPAAAGVDLPAAAGRRPRLAGRHRHPVDPGPGRLRLLPDLDLRRPGRHGDPDRQRPGQPGGAAAGRGHPVRSQHLDALRRDPGRAGGRDRRPGQSRPRRRADRRADPPHRVTDPRRGRPGAGPAALGASRSPWPGRPG